MRAMKRTAALSLALLALGCSGPVVDTGEPPVTTKTTPPSPAPPQQPRVEHLVNGFDYAGEVNGATWYFFTTPSGRWECAIVPRVTAGCQAAGGQSSLGITGAPDSVLDAAGEESTPNAIEVPRDGEPRFSAVDPPGFGLAEGTPAELPFNRVLSVAGFRCNVQEATGVSCMSDKSRQGFTFSAEGFTPAYVEVPADAP